MVVGLLQHATELKDVCRPCSGTAAKEAGQVGGEAARRRRVEEAFEVKLAGGGGVWRNARNAAAQNEGAGRRNMVCRQKRAYRVRFAARKAGARGRRRR